MYIEKNPSGKALKMNGVINSTLEDIKDAEDINDDKDVKETQGKINSGLLDEAEEIGANPGCPEEGEAAMGLLLIQGLGSGNT